MIAFLLVWQLNQFTISLCWWFVIGSDLPLYEARITSLPQLVLGMYFFVVNSAYLRCGSRAFESDYLVIILANLMWTIAYDTMYAMVDSR